MELRQILNSVDLFEGLSQVELEQVAGICTEKRFMNGDIIAQEGDFGTELYIITEGFVEVLLGERSTSTARVVVCLGSGQIIGEMALLDQGRRSASVRAASDPTVVQVIQRQDFEALCQSNTNIGYIVMRNLAADLSFKLRHRNLSER
ncbi:MAG: cyclic nucleotide-binding domain-containing protein [Chloroflexota bacterium]